MARVTRLLVALLLVGLCVGCTQEVSTQGQIEKSKQLHKIAEQSPDVDKVD